MLKSQVKSSQVKYRLDLLKNKTPFLSHTHLTLVCSWFSKALPARWHRSGPFGVVAHSEHLGQGHLAPRFLKGKGAPVACTHIWVVPSSLGADDACP